MSVLLLGCCAFVITWALSGLLLRYAQALNLIDMPNQRSSHSIPKARGGGIAIALTFFMALLYLNSAGLLEFNFFVAALGAGAVVALSGFVDDFIDVSVRWRLLSHFFAAIWALYWLSGLPPLLVFGFTFDLGVIGDRKSVV